MLKGGKRISRKYCWHWFGLQDIVLILQLIDAENQLTRYSSTFPKAGYPELYWKWRNLAEHKQTSKHVHIHFSLLLIVNGMWLAALSFCYLNLSVIIGENLKLWFRISPLSPKYFLLRYLITALYMKLKLYPSFKVSLNC